MWAKQKQPGFTIVELLIVIVVIGILAAITVVAYNGIQNRSRNTKIESDLMMLQKAIIAARVHSGEVATRYITLSTSTASACVSTASDVDISKRTTDSAACWASYDVALDRISAASNINVRSLVDPWGRPYFLDENEKEGAGTCGIGKDNTGVYKLPRVKDEWSMAITNSKTVPFITPGC